MLNMAMVLFLLICLFEIFGLTAPVTLQIAGKASFGNQFCPGSTAEYKCQTTEGSLLWEIDGTAENHIFHNMTQPQNSLGIFLLRLDGVSLMNGTVSAVNSTAVVSNVQPSYNGTVLRCSEYADLSMFSEAVLRVTGPPPAPAVNPITVVEDGSIDSTLLIRWSQNNCAVQYVVTIINSSDDRVYPNITTSNTNTAVTLPTGVEFCFRLVAVDSIGRRGPYSVPICYRKVYATSSSVNQLFTPFSVIVSNIDKIVTSSSTSTVSVTITVTPVEGGVNTVYIVVGLLGAIIIIVVPVLFLMIVLIAARIKRNNSKKATGTSQILEMESKESGEYEEYVKSNYKDFLKHYYQDPLPHDDKLFVSNCNERGYTEQAIIEKDVKSTSEMEENNINCTSSSTKNKSPSIVALNDILKPDKEGKPVQLVLIEGTSGIGKTTLAWQLCHKWAKEELDSLKDYDLVILVRLRKNRAQKATKLEHLLPYDNTTDLEGLIAAIGKGERVLIVCDGFDELPHHQQGSEFYVRLFSCELLPAATVVVTTQPSASEVFKNIIYQDIERELEIAGFTEKGIIEFAKSIFSMYALDSFLSYIQNNPPINGMMYLPLSAVIVAKIYEESYKTDTPFPNTMSELFNAFAHVLLRRHLESNNQTVKMPSSLQDIRKLPPRVASQFSKIVEIAYDGMCNNSYVFNELPEDFEHLGLMRIVHRENIARGQHFTFVFFHHTLQEYLAALHIANQLSSDLNSLKLQLENKDMIARFLAGICHNNRHDYCNNLHRWLVEFLCQICFHRLQALQLVHCGYECPSIMHDLKVEYSEKNAFIVVEPQVGIDWYAMGHCISHFDEVWGLHATNLRKENIDLLEKGLKSSIWTSVSGRLKFLRISRSEVSVSVVITSLGNSCQLQCLELLYVKIDEKDKEALRKLITVGSGPKSLTYKTGNEHTHTRSLIPMLLDTSSLEELVLRTGSEINMDTELLPCKNKNLKKLTISCELVQLLAALLPNTSLTHLVVDSLVYDSDLPFLTSLIESNSTLQVLELGKIVVYASTPKPTYTSLKSASHNLRKLVEVASTHCSSQKLKLHKEDYMYLPEYHDNSIVCSH